MHNGVFSITSGNIYGILSIHIRVTSFLSNSVLHMCLPLMICTRFLAGHSYEAPRQGFLHVCSLWSNSSIFNEMVGNFRLSDTRVTCGSPSSQTTAACAPTHVGWPLPPAVPLPPPSLSPPQPPQRRPAPAARPAVPADVGLWL